VVTEGGRLAWLERDGDDFPFYNGRPVALTGAQWLVVMAAVAAAYGVLLFGGFVFSGRVLSFVPVLVYALLPLAALSWVASGQWRALFRRIRFRDIRLMIGFAILNVIVTVVAGTLLASLTETTKNAGMTTMASQGATDIAIFYIRAAPQLLGEELMTLLPFLAIMWLCVSRMNTGRVTAILVALLATAVLFAAEHLSTYGWNVVQALGGVGVARIVLTLPYIMTKNVWVSTGTHILNDWIMFSVSVLGAHR
jgi:membrane protease YdiL (CAAX protease family)